MAKKSFILYHDQKEVIDELDDEQAGKLIKAIYEYNVNKKETLSGVLKLVFIPFKTAFDRDEDKWEEISEKRSQAGKKGMKTRWKDNENITNDNKSYQKITSITVNGSVSDNVNDNVNVNDSVSVSVNNKPTDRPHNHTDILNYCLSVFKGYSKEELQDVAKKIFEHYVKTNWKGVDNWQDRVKMWINEDIQNGKIEKLPDWWGKEVKKEEATQEEIDEMKKLLEGYK